MLFDIPTPMLWKKISDGSHMTYAQSNGSWLDTTPEEIYRLIYVGLVKVGMSVNRYWSIKPFTTVKRRESLLL